MENTDKLLRLCYELEGALKVAQHHDDDLSANMVHERMQALTQAYIELYDKAANTTDKRAVHDESAIENESGNAHELDKGQEKTETAAYIQFEEDPKLHTVKRQEAEEPEVKPEMQATTEAIERGFEEENTDYANTDDANTDASKMPSAAAHPVAETTAQPVSINDVMADRPGELRLDEALSRRGARNLRKAFTLNDKFRFRRELFKGDDKLFGETLDDIQSLMTYDDAVAYVRETLGWDMDNSEVADFMQVVQNHFNAM